MEMITESNQISFAKKLNIILLELRYIQWA